MSLPLFAKLEAQIASLEEQQKMIRSLSDKMTEVCFDEEDRKIIQQKLQQISDTKTQVEDSLQKKREIYNTQIIGMEKQLTQRQKIFESCDQTQHLFKEFPDMLEFFARKQSNLSETLTKIKDQLQK